MPLVVISLFSIGISFYCYNFKDLEGAGIAIIIFIGLFILFFALGVGGGVWTVNSEIFPLHLRSTAVGITSSANWVGNFIISMSFLSMMSFELGQVLIWFILGSFAIYYWIFVYQRLPETKGVSLEKVLKLFEDY